MDRKFLIVINVLIILVTSTNFFYPTARPGAVLSVEPSFWEIEKIDIIELSPIFDVGGRDSYSILLSPDLDAYIRDYPEVKRIILGGGNVIQKKNGDIEYQDIHFSFTYWILYCVIPSILAGVAMAAVLHNKLKSKNKLP